MSSESVYPDVIVKTKTKPKAKQQIRRIPPYNVILENDNFHSCEFVVDVLKKALGCTEQRAVLLMLQAHTTGRAVVWTGLKEVAELKVEQICTFHEHRPEANLHLGPLGCTLEPAPGG